MRKFAFFGAVIVLAISQPLSAYAAGGCGNMTLCIKNPPFPPTPPSCTTYPNYCSFMQPHVKLFEKLEQPQAPSGPGYSIQLDNLTKDQVQAIFDQLGINKSKVELPR